jgi:hypothetical protein
MDRYRANKPTILSMLERENKKPYEVFAQFFSAEEIEERKKIDYRWARFPFDESEISKYKLGKLQLDIQAEFLSKLNNA